MLLFLFVIILYMASTKGRFHIDHRTEVINKYVLYVEELFVSFKDKQIKKELKENLKTIKKEIDDLSNGSNEEAISKVTKRIKRKLKELEAENWIVEQDKTKKAIETHKANIEKLKKKKGDLKEIELENEALERNEAYLKAVSSINYEKEIKTELKELEKELKILKDPKSTMKRRDELIVKVQKLEEKINNTSLKEKLKEYKKETKEELSLLRKSLKAAKKELEESEDPKAQKQIEKLCDSYNHRVEEVKNEINSLKQQIEFNDPSTKRILNGVTFGLRKGETLAIVGANGAGKTVLLETILGLNIPDSYSRMVLNLGRKHYANNLKEVGIQYQQSKMSASITVRQLIAEYKKLYIDRIDESLIEKMLDVFHIRPFYTSKVDSLSGGQKQRLNLLLAVMNKPKLMILDEFITGLDVNSVEEIITFVNELKIKLKASMIIISHQPEEIEELADRVILLKEGKVVLETYVEDIIEEYGDVTEFIREMI